VTVSDPVFPDRAVELEENEPMQGVQPTLPLLAGNAISCIARIGLRVFSRFQARNPTNIRHGA
jgi:hypothetical protein